MNMSQKPKLEKSYHIPLALFDKAFRKFQKKFVYPKNIVISLLLLAIGIVYVDAAIKDPSSTMAYILIVICLAMILVMWYNPLKLRRNLMRSLKELENDIYTLSLYDDGVTVRTEDAPTETATEESEQTQTELLSTVEETENSEKSNENGFNQLFEEEEAPISLEPIAPTELPFGAGLKIFEYDEYFMLYLVKRNFYVVPKKDFTENEISQLREAFAITETK